MMEISEILSTFSTELFENQKSALTEVSNKHTVVTGILLQRLLYSIGY